MARPFRRRLPVTGIHRECTAVTMLDKPSSRRAEMASAVHMALRKSILARGNRARARRPIGGSSARAWALFPSPLAPLLSSGSLASTCGINGVRAADDAPDKVFLFFLPSLSLSLRLLLSPRSGPIVEIFSRKFLAEIDGGFPAAGLSHDCPGGTYETLRGSLYFGDRRRKAGRGSLSIAVNRRGDNNTFRLTFVIVPPNGFSVSSVYRY